MHSFCPIKKLSLCLTFPVFSMLMPPSGRAPICVSNSKNLYESNIKFCICPMKVSSGLSLCPVAPINIVSTSKKYPSPGIIAIIKI